MWGQLSGHLNAAVEAAAKKIDEFEETLDAAVNEDMNADDMDLPDMDGMFVGVPQSNQGNETSHNTGVTTSAENEEVDPIEKLVEKKAEEPKQFNAEIQDAIKVGVKKEMKKVSSSHAKELKALRFELEERAAAAEKLVKERGEASANMQKELQAQIEALKAQSSNHVADVEDLKKEVVLVEERHRASVVALEKEKSAKQDLLTEMQDARTRHLKDAADMTSKYEDLLKEARSVASANDGELASKASAAVQEAAALQGELSRVSEELQETQSELSRSQKSSNESEKRLMDKVEELEGNLGEARTALERMEGELKGATATSDREREEAGRLRSEMEAQQEALRSGSENLAELQGEVAGLKETLEDSFSKMSQTSEVLAERERVCETLTTQLAESQAKVAELEAAMEKSSKAKDSGTGTLQRQVSELKAANAESTGKLEAFEQEGRVLAKKHSDMLQTVRKYKGEMKGKDTEIAKLTADKEGLTKTIAGLNERLGSAESQTSSTNKSLSAMQAASQASTDKVARLEVELAAKVEELGSAKKALESAWDDVKESKREMAVLRAELEELQRQLGEGTNRLKETDDIKRDVESREAMLRASNAQLQESMQRQMNESTSREERLRDEVGEMRKRWQEAITSREALASEMTSSTQPLLGQISKLQETLRLKGESWHGVESSLSERALRAESALEVAEQKKGIAEDQLATSTAQLESVQRQLQDAQDKVNMLSRQVDKLKHTESISAERVEAAEAKLGLEQAQSRSLQASVRDLEARYEVKLQEAKVAADLLSKAQEETIENLGREKNLLREEMSTIRERDPPLSTGESSTSMGSVHKLAPSSPVLAAIDLDRHTHVGSTPIKGFVQERLPSGEVSFAANVRLEKMLRMREEEINDMSNKVRQLENAREALLKEVTFLSSRNAQLEEEADGVSGLKAELEKSKKQQSLLLLMVGEKDEEIEAAHSDMKEVKLLYRAQLDALLAEKLPQREENSGTDDQGHGAQSSV